MNRSIVGWFLSPAWSQGFPAEKIGIDLVYAERKIRCLDISLILHAHYGSQFIWKIAKRRVHGKWDGIVLLALSAAVPLAPPLPSRPATPARRGTAKLAKESRRQAQAPNQKITTRTALPPTSEPFRFESVKPTHRPRHPHTLEGWGSTTQARRGEEL